MRRLLAVLLFSLFLPVLAQAGPLRPEQGGTGTATVFPTNSVPVVGSNGMYGYSLDFLFNTTGSVFTLGGPSVTTSKFIFNPAAGSGGFPCFSAPYCFDTTIGDSAINAFTFNVRALGGGALLKQNHDLLNIVIGNQTPVPAGFKGDVIGINLNLTSAQLSGDEKDDGFLGFAFTMTNTGGIPMEGYGGSLIARTIIPKGVSIMHAGISKFIDGEGADAYEGVRVSCGAGSPALARCDGSGVFVRGSWKNGIWLLADTAAIGGVSATSWLTMIRLENTHATQPVTNGIQFINNAQGFTNGIVLNANSLLFFGATTSGSSLKETTGNRPTWSFADSLGEILIFKFQQIEAQGKALEFDSARGVAATPTAVANTDPLMFFDFKGYDGAAYVSAAQIEALVSNTVASGNVPGNVLFLTRNASGTLAERARIVDNGIQLTGGTISVVGADINVSTTTSGDVVLSPGGTSDIKWGRATVALGAGGTATLGATGGSGPATATQNGWVRVKLSDGTIGFVSMWK